MARRSQMRAKFNPTPVQAEHLIDWADWLIFKRELWRRSKVWQAYLVTGTVSALAVAEWGEKFWAAFSSLAASFGLK